MANTAQGTFQAGNGRQFWVITTGGTGTVNVDYIHSDGQFCPAGDGAIDAGKSATVPCGGSETRIRVTPSAGANYNVW